jgi:hypothetical protein
MALDVEDLFSIIILFICCVMGSILLMLLVVAINNLSLSPMWFLILFPAATVCILVSIIGVIHIILTGNDQTLESPATPEPEPYVVDPKDRKYQDQLNLKHSNQQPECVVCQDNVQSTLLSCGHANLCHLCAQRIKKYRGDCPICQRRITEIEEDFFTQREYAPSRDEEALAR